MDAFETTIPGPDELDQLEQDRRRIEAQLHAGASPLLEAMLRDEHRWVARRKRALGRTAVSSRAVLHFRGATHGCHVRDVSAHGAGVDMDEQPRVGDLVCLVLTDLGGAPALSAIVRHVTGERVGLEFVPKGEAAKQIAEELGRRFAARDG